jgi:Kunitz/Bovine pancreatic trypsin inhibitor domain
MPQGGSAGAGPVWMPPERCQQAFDQGPCDANFSVFAYIDGSCLEVAYGGCEGNDNRFYELEECLAVCEGRPSVMPCPEGRVRHSICIECGPAGGCGRTIDACAVECLMDEDCNGGPLMGCADGVCQTRGCI